MTSDERREDIHRTVRLLQGAFEINDVDDWASWLESDAPFDVKQPLHRPTRRESNRCTHLYVFGDVKKRAGMFKIGITSNPDRRLNTLRVHSPFPCSGFAVLIERPDIKELERILHSRFSRLGKHSHGEWFELTSDDLDYVESLL